MGENRTTYRASAAPLAMTCPGSVNAPPDEILIDSINPAGIVGTAVHAVCKAMVDENDLPNIGTIIQPFGLAPAQIHEVYSLSYAAWEFWRNNGPAFGGGVETEKELIYGLHSGHLDILSMPWNDDDPPDLTHVLDWKTTRLDLNYEPQLLFYAGLVVSLFPKIRRVKTVIVFLRDRTANIKEWDLTQILEFSAEFDRRVHQWDGRSYTPGGHCAYCRRFANCPAHAQMVRHTSGIMSDFPIEHEGPGYLNDPNWTIEMYQRVAAVETLVNSFKVHVRAAVEQAGGELRGADGQSLKLIPSKRDTINAALAWPIISPILTHDELAECTGIKKDEMLKAVASHAQRGQKGKAKVKIMEDLKDAGALSTTEFNVLRVMQSKETAKEIEIGTGTETD